MSNGVFALALATALGCGLAGGAFFAFSTFVMRALGRLPAPQGIAAMQSINVVVINPLFMGALFGTALLSVITGVVAVVDWDEASAYLLGGSVVYLLGTIVTTGAFNVPRNNVLAALDPVAPEAAQQWERYLVEWTAWNHVRTAAGLVALGLLIAAVHVA